MYAVIETGGKQYRVCEGDVITIEKLKNAEVNDKVTFENVLLISKDGDTQVGTPYLDASVFGKVVENGKGKKVIVYKYKAKKNYRKKQGHRQPFTKVEITGIGEDKEPAKKQEVENEAETDEKVEAEVVEAEVAETKIEEEVSDAPEISVSMKKDELIAFAKENNIEIDEKAKKQVIVDTIKENLK